MDDRRLAAGCADGMVHLVDLRCLRAATDGRGGAAKPAALTAHALLPAHTERVSWTASWQQAGGTLASNRGLDGK